MSAEYLPPQLDPLHSIHKKLKKFLFDIDGPRPTGMASPRNLQKFCNANAPADK